MRAAGSSVALIAGIAGLYSAPALARTRIGRIAFPTLTRAASRDAVGLTFDDGPGAHLDSFLGLLEERRARATFFVLGEQVERSPGCLREIVACGHEVGVHGYRHQNHLRLSPSQVIDDLRRSRTVIEDAAGVATRCYRPPYGVFSWASWWEVGRQGWRRVLWERWGKDWETRATPESIAENVGLPAAGDILLLHDADEHSAPGSWRNTLGALPIILDRVAAAGLSACSVSELLDEDEQERSSALA